MSWMELIKQNLWIVYLILGILGAIGGLIYIKEIIKKFWSEKISPLLNRFYEWIKSKIPKRGDEMTKENSISPNIYGYPGNCSRGDVRRMYWRGKAPSC